MFRVMPVLTMIDGSLVKTTSFRRPRYIGDPINALKIFNDKEVDEAVLLDIRASKKGSQIDLQQIAEVVSEAFMPIAYGGGITTCDHMHSIFLTGVEKIILGNAASHGDIIREAAATFGSQSVVACLDFKKNRFAKGYSLRHRTGVSRIKSVADEVCRVRDAGAGEIFISSISHDGTLLGIDEPLINEVRHLSDVPLVYLGGTSSTDDMYKVAELGFSGVGVGAYFVYRGPRNAVLISYDNPFKLAELEY